MLTRRMSPVFAMALLLGISCQKNSVNLNDHLLGRWNVVQVKGQQYTNGVPGAVLTDNSPSGYIQFNSNGSGEQNYSFTLFGTSYPNTGNFVWSSSASEISIKLLLQPDMIWRRSINEPNRQEATYTIIISSTVSIDYTLTLEK